MGSGGSEAVQPRGKEYIIIDMASDGKPTLRVESTLASGHFYPCFKVS